MLKLDDRIYFSSISYNNRYNRYWDNLRLHVPDGGVFAIDLGWRINPNRFIGRVGTWSIPFPQDVMPEYAMPQYDPDFKMTWAEVTDLQAVKVKQGITEGKKYAVMFSGGIDSTVIMVSLLKNLTPEECQSLLIVSSQNTIIENPRFWQKYIQGKFAVMDSTKIKYDGLIKLGYIPITGDLGDNMFGTLAGLNLFFTYSSLVKKLSPERAEAVYKLKDAVTDDSVHWSRYTDILIQYFQHPRNPKFGQLLHEKIARNIQDAPMPIHSLQDYFWWEMFNLKYSNCASRGSIYLNDTLPVPEVVDKTINWYNDADYQRWSMVNNGNGQKIRKSAATYKWTAREYIYEFDHNDWYFNFKPKIESLGPGVSLHQNLAGIPVEKRPVHRFGLDKNYDILYMTDPAVTEYIEHHLFQFNVDW